MLEKTKVKDLMTKDVLTVECEEATVFAFEKLMKHKISAMPVVDNGKMVGIVTATDLGHNLILDHYQYGTKVKSAMVKDVACVSSEDTIKDAVSVMFDNTFYINNQYYGLYAFIMAIIIYILNQTIKPILVHLTLPITALTMGLFYPIINVFILYIASFILGDDFQIHGIILPFIIAIVISILNMFMEGMIIKPIIYKGNEK